jgi:CyaY protein
VVLDEVKYVELADAELANLLDAMDALGPDGVEAELSNGILTLDFEEDPPIVVNSHRAARQIWMAASRSAWHFDWDPKTQTWIAAKTGDELWSTLDKHLSERLGASIKLPRPS